MRSEPVKDAAQDVTQDVTQNMAEGVLGATKDGNVKLFIMKVLILPTPNTRVPTHRGGAYLFHRHPPAAETTPRLTLGDT